MEYLVEHLVKFGVTAIMVNVSYLHQKIENYFCEGQRFAPQIGHSFGGHINDERVVSPKPIGSAGGMKKIQEFGGFFDETTIVICGDAIIDLDIKSALFEHRRKGALASVITKEVPNEKSSEYTRVTPHTDMTEMVVCENYCIDRHGKMMHVSDCPTNSWRDLRDRRTAPRGTEPEGAGNAVD